MSLDKSKFTITKAGNVATATYKDENAFFETEEVSRKDIEKVFKHTQEYVAGCAKASAELSTDVMKEDSKIDEVHVTMPYGVSKRASVTGKARRSVTYPGMNGGDPVTKSDLRIVVKDPHSKVSKTAMKEMQSQMTKELLS